MLYQNGLETHINSLALFPPIYLSILLPPSPPPLHSLAISLSILYHLPFLFIAGLITLE